MIGYPFLLLIFMQQAEQVMDFCDQNGILHYIKTDTITKNSNLDKRKNSKLINLFCKFKRKNVTLIGLDT